MGKSDVSTFLLEEIYTLIIDKDILRFVNNGNKINKKKDQNYLRNRIIVRVWLAWL